MTNKIFLDTSALAKLYVQETGSQEVCSWYESADDIFVSALCIAEIIASLNRLKREKKLPHPYYLNLKESLFEDQKSWQIVSVSDDIISKAIFCLEQAQLRTADAIHIASALLIPGVNFLSADKEQCKAAQKLGIQVIPITLL